MLAGGPILYNFKRSNFILIAECSQCNDPPSEIKQNQPNEKKFIKAPEADHFGQDGIIDHCKHSSGMDQWPNWSISDSAGCEHLPMTRPNACPRMCALGHTIISSSPALMSRLPPLVAHGPDCQILIDQSPRGERWQRRWHRVLPNIRISHKIPDKISWPRKKAVSFRDNDKL